MARIGDTERRRLYGTPCDQTRLVLITTPWGIRVRCHRLVAGRLHSALIFAAEQSNWTPRRIDSYACRTIRGSTTTSLHSYGLAWDLFNRPLPEPVDVWGPTNAPDSPFRQAMRDMGFVAGADFTTRQDFPHFEWAGPPPPLKTVVAPAAPTIEPASVKPVQHFRYGEATGVRISTHFVSVPALDNQGRGWIDIPYPFERVVEVVGQGNDPAADGHYWEPVVLNVSPRGAATKVTIKGRPNSACGFYWRLLEEQ